MILRRRLIRAAPAALALLVTRPLAAAMATRHGWDDDLPQPMFQADFRRAFPPQLTFARASTVMGFGYNGLLSTFVSGNPASPTIDFATGRPIGLAVYQSTTNRALRNRDLTNNTSWVKSNATAALNQIGIDGAANAASSLTATNANATCLQSITIASNTFVFSAFIKRVTGTGEIDVTMDGGATWTRVDASLSTTIWTRVPVNVGLLQTVTNPQIGFRIVTSGDAIAVDYAQCDLASTSLNLPAPPIATTSGNVTTQTDVPSIALSAIGVSPNVFSIAGLFWLPIGFSDTPFNRSVLSVTDGTVNNRVEIFYDRTTSSLSWRASNANVLAGGTPLSFPVLTENQLVPFAVTYNNGYVEMSTNRFTPFPSVSGNPLTAVPGLTTLFIGSRNGTANILHSAIAKLLVFNQRLSSMQLLKVQRYL